MLFFAFISRTAALLSLSLRLRGCECPGALEKLRIGREDGQTRYGRTELHSASPRSPVFLPSVSCAIIPLSVFHRRWNLTARWPAVTVSHWMDGGCEGAEKDRLASRFADRH
jgi:hypothetical protein